MFHTGPMLRRSFLLLLICLFVSRPVLPWQEPATCGTHSGKASELQGLHRKAADRASRLGVEALPAGSGVRDVGDLVLLEDSGDLVARTQPFDLDLHAVAFLPSPAAASQYGFQVTSGGYDQAAASSGTLLSGLGDDDTRQIGLLFAFPFYGNSYRQVFVNSDGNLTFNAPDTDTSERSLGRMTAGPPRISPLFRDLDPTRAINGVRVLSEAGRFVVSWVQVPEYAGSGRGTIETFQVRLFPDGRIEFAYAGTATDGAIVGLSPGGMLGATSVVSFIQGSTQMYSGTVAERFNNQQEVDVFAAALKFYTAHEDAYDYLVFFNNMGVAAAPGAVAYEVTVRNINRDGYGDDPKDIGAQLGSPRRLQSVLNMGNLGQYPADPDTPLPGRGSITGDTAMTVLGHEAGHLFLAFASYIDPDNPGARPMLKPDGAHWSFNFNSDASLMEGNRIRDNGDGTFTTTATVQGYSLLDQYLMGLAPPDQVPTTFLVTNTLQSPAALSQVGVTFLGARRDVHIEDILEAEGRRAPDSTVSQRHFRFAFILVIPAGTTPAASDLQKLETLRGLFEQYFNRYAGNRAFAETTLRRSLGLSLAPASGVLAGRSMDATVFIATPAAASLTVSLQGAAHVSMPPSVTIAAGATSATFQVTGLTPGVDDISAVPSNPQFETGYARVQVNAAASSLHLTLTSGDGQVATPGTPLTQPVVFRVADINELPYEGLGVKAAPSAGGSVSPIVVNSDAQGQARFSWTPGAGFQHQLTASLADAPDVPAATATALSGPYFEADWVVNSGSYVQGLTPGGFGTIFGYNLSASGSAAGSLPFPGLLANVQVLFNGTPAGLHYVSDRQINFLAPSTAQPGLASLVVSTPLGSSSTVTVPLLAASPGIFFDPFSGFGVILGSGREIVIYCTGLGSVDPATRQTLLPVKVFVGPLELTPTSGSADPYYPGLYEVQATVPVGVSGEQLISIEANGVRSNSVRYGL